MTTEAIGGHGGRRPGAGRPRKQAQADHVERFNAAKADKERALADLRTIDLRQKERTLLEVVEVERVIGTAFASVAQRLLSLPDELERLHGIDADLAEQIEITIHEVMSGLADDLQTVASVGHVPADV